MRVLAVDTTTPRGSLAVVSAEGVEAEVRQTTAHGHSRWLLAAVDRTLRDLGVEPRALDGFAVTVGPGSFTGLRVGMSSVQGLGLAAGRPCVGLPSLDILALSAAGRAPTIVALMDTVRGEVFSGVYDLEGHLTGDRRAGRLEGLLGGLEGEVAFVGEGALRYRSQIEAAVPGAVFPEVDLFLAAGLGRAAIETLRAGEGVPPGELRPLYLRGAHIRKPRR
ncbi:MAG: tRNA (adenosine(37)-N6)-threonylcarbamoyltransferase complex dimerization subunit type 1 TsaB [Acidobacteriota bacterium]